MEFIKNIFWEMPVDLWMDGFFGKVMAFLWFSVMIVLVGLVSFMLFMAVDGLFLSYIPGEAKVVNKRFDPAHTETHMQTMIVGKTTMLIPQTYTYPDRYYLGLEINSLVGEKQVDKTFFDEINEGQLVSIKYSKRRISNSISYE